mgnify:CR=1 FL=1
MRWLLVVAGLLAAGGLAQTPPPPAAQTAEQNPLRLGVQLYALGRYDATLRTPRPSTGSPGPSSSSGS